MAVDSYVSVGRELVIGKWGFERRIDQTQSYVIGNLSERQVELSLLAYVGSQLSRLAGKLDNMPGLRTPVADGCLEWLKTTTDTKVKSCDSSGLSVRARKALANFEYLSEISVMRLLAIHGVGGITLREVLAWTERVRNDRKRGTDG